MIDSFGEKTPAVDVSCFVADSAAVLGDVIMGPLSSVWFGAVIRGDVGRISIGRRSNIQDLCVLHVEQGGSLSVGDDVTVGHRAILHGCAVRDRVLVGMGAVIMNGAELGEGCIVGAGSVVTEGQRVPPRSLVLGVPARVARELTDEEVAETAASADRYSRYASQYIEQGF
ncbi:MAG: gamma carbonic anhydrase family protein [Proteobacteria bacterium]|nr:gamma carbonic anhydrase family protein [Pseudomonadota bacterium]